MKLALPKKILIRLLFNKSHLLNISKLKLPKINVLQHYKALCDTIRQYQSTDHLQFQINMGRGDRDFTSATTLFVRVVQLTLGRDPIISRNPA